VILHGGRGVSYGDGIKILGAYVNSPATAGNAGCDRVTVKGNLIETPRNNGVFVSNQAGGPLTDIAISDNIIRYDTSQSWVSQNGRAIYCSSAADTVRALASDDT